jgi:hypothetical protein
MSWSETIRHAEEKALAGLANVQSRIRRKMRIYPGDHRYSAVRKNVADKDQRKDQPYDPGSILDMMARGNATPFEAGTPMADNLRDEPKLEHDQPEASDARILRVDERDEDRVVERKRTPIVSINGEDVDPEQMDDERAA